MTARKDGAPTADHAPIASSSLLTPRALRFALPPDLRQRPIAGRCPPIHGSLLGLLWSTVSALCTVSTSS